MTDWKPIDTAPRDGTPILAIDVSSQYIVVEYVMLDDGTAFWETGHMPSTGVRYVAGYQLTHWMPLPEAPHE